MAKLTLTIYGFPEKEAQGGKVDITIGDKVEEGKLTRYTQYWERTKNTNGKWESGGTADVGLHLSINTFSINQKMYAPDEITVEIFITAESDKQELERKVNLSKDDALSMFAQKRVSLTWWNGEDATYTVGSDYYVNEVVPCKFADKTKVTLKIYSPDKLLTLHQYSRSWTAKKLDGDILKDQLPNYVLPYDKTAKVECDTSMARHMKRGPQEHIFPYLVQYNESFYDMLARTTNRWGEFLYYYNGKLRIGFDADVKKAEEISNYYSVTYRDYTSTQPAQENAGSYVSEAPYDDNVLNSTVMKDSAARVMMTINYALDTSRFGDNYWMMKVGQLLTNRQPIVNFVVGTIINDLAMWRQMEMKVKDKNQTFNDLYFGKKSKKYISKEEEQYFEIGGMSFYNQFSEGRPILNATEYAKILVGEFSAADNTVEIDYDTYAPHLHLGQLITVDSQPYIVTEISAAKMDKDAAKLRFHVTAISKVTIKEGTETVMDDFYPTVIPAGHIRQTGPQVAVVVDANDPNKKNRVRVKYPWQLGSVISTLKDQDVSPPLKERYEDINAKSLKGHDVSDATPWLLYASPSGPHEAGVHARHYLAEKVLINYINNNIERPYVVGSVNTNIPFGLTINQGAAILQAPNGEYIKVHEGRGQGATAFLSGIQPGLNFVRGMFNWKDWFGDDEMSKRFEGGVELGDRYGIWSIRGSTDGRSVAIASNWGNVIVSAFTGIHLSAPNGDITISGKNVNIEAGNNLTLTSGTNIRNKFVSLSSYYDGKFSFESITKDISSAVANQVLSYGLRMLDLSILRSLIEVFWRPQEGCLTIKSNRYLKLSAGGATAGYPNAAYKNQMAQKNKVRGAIAKSDALNEDKANKTVEALGKVEHVVNKMIAKYKENYKVCVAKRKDLDDAIALLAHYSNRVDGDNARREATPGEVCKIYDEMKSLFWNPKTDEITEKDMGFKDLCKHDAADNVDNETVTYARQTHPWKNSRIKSDQTVKKFVIGKRKTLKADVVKKANKLLKSITKLRMIPLLKSDDNIKGSGDRVFYGRFKYISTTDKMDQEYIDAFINAFDYQKCENTTFYKYAYNQEKAITDARANLPTGDNLAATLMNEFNFHKDALMRQVTLNMVEAMGMSSVPIFKKLGKQDGHTQIVNIEGPNAQPVKPDKPKTEEDLENNFKWKLYVQSLQFTSTKPMIPSSLGITANRLVNNFKIWTSFTEYYSWGDPRKGEILFAVGQTLSLKRDGTISKTNSVYNQGTISKALLNDKQLEKYNSVNKKITDKLALIGAGNDNDVPDAVGEPEVDVNQQIHDLEARVDQLQQQLHEELANMQIQNQGGVDVEPENVNEDVDEE